MKKIFVLSALVSIIFTSCTSLENNNFTFTTPNSNVLQAGFADDTRTYVENNQYLRWHEDDRLTAFYSNTLNRQYKFNGKTGDNSGTFSLVPSGELGTGNAFDCIYALYPYNETATITDEGVISLTLPATQSYAENSFGNGANTMLAVTENLEDTFLAFKNACGYLKLKLYAPEGGVIKSIELKGNNNEKIAGAATATIAFGEAPIVTMSEDATTSITLDCGDGVTLGTTAETATEFWVVVPEMTFEKGLAINVTDNLGGVYTKTTDKEITIERNSVQPMAALEVKCERTMPANNEIWYTSTDGVVVKPYATEVFGANIVSNTYENGKGIITFDGDVTTIGEMAFYCNLSYGYHSKLQTITLPNSVISLGISAFEGCESLVDIVMPNAISEIPRCAFAKSGLKEFVLNNNITIIRAYAFNACNKLTNITIPANMTDIEKSAFSDCLYLQCVYCKAAIPPVLGTDVFYQSGGTKRLKHIYVPNTYATLYKRVINWSDYADIISDYDFTE